MRDPTFAATLALLLALLAPCSIAAQQDREDAPALSARIDGPPPPIAPSVINRDGEGNATVRAIRLTAPIEVDGRLDEAIYREELPISGFMQVLPGDGDPATEKTEAWITFDENNVYVGARMWDSAPESEWVANEMRRDIQQLSNNDNFGVAFDTFYDRRNGVFFYINPVGGHSEFQYTNEGNPNRDWNPIWEVRTGRFEGGWTIEMQVPFKSLRYRAGRGQVWGVQMRRAVRRKNEWNYLTRIPRSTGRGQSAVMRISRWATLVGIEAPPAARNLEIKPYAISGLKTDRMAVPAISNDASADAGVDVKLGVTKSLTADFTVNTDFAQVEADEQQVNLTRFDLSFPEKREFFLESRDLFQFAIGTFSAGLGRDGNAPTMFFSRRIGLQSGEVVPVRAGGRLFGKVGAFDVGAMNIRTGTQEALDLESTDFTVLRLRRDVFARGSIGMLFANRSRSVVAEGSNQTYGVDGNMSVGDVFLSGYYAATRTPGLTDNDNSYRASFSYNGDLWGALVDHLRVGDNFNPEVGFLRRWDFRQTAASVRFSPRPESDLIRRLSFGAGIDYLENGTAGFVESRERQGSVEVEFESSDAFDVSVTDRYEFLSEPFRISGGRGIQVPPGRYSFRGVTVGLSLGQQRWYSGGLSVERGGFFTGDRTTAAVRGGRISVSTRLSLEPTLSFNWLDLPEGSFRNDLAVTRVNYAFSPRMFFSGLVQYSSSSNSFSTNLRLRWEYRPGSELFIVYTESRDTDVLDRFSELGNRGLTVKVNYLLRM